MSEQLAGWGGFADFIAGMRADPSERPSALKRALAMRDKPDPDPRDADDAAANLMARGYRPGSLSDVARQLADAQAELAGEEAKLERARRRSERVMRDHAAGKITAFDIARMQDTDEGDENRAAMLRRRCGRLQRQMQDTAALISPQREVPADPLEAAIGRARAAGDEALARAQLARPAAPAPRPFDSGDDADAPDCAECAAAGATRSESAQIHGELRRDEGAYAPGDVIATGYEVVR
jgi:hypothetical protein